MKWIFRLNYRIALITNSKLYFTLCGAFREEISTDNISQKSLMPDLKENEVIAGTTKSIIVPNTKENDIQRSKSVVIKPSKKTQKQHNNNEGNIAEIEEQNRRMKEELKNLQRLRKENGELRKKIKQQEFTKVKEMKQKIHKLRQQIQNTKGEIKVNRNLEAQIKNIEDDIFKCKIKIMKAMNFCAEYGGSKLVNSVNDYCGIIQK